MTFCELEHVGMHGRGYSFDRVRGLDEVSPRTAPRRGLERRSRAGRTEYSFEREDDLDLLGQVHDGARPHAARRLDLSSPAT